MTDFIQLALAGTAAGALTSIARAETSLLTSLAVDPPSLIVSINRSASSWPLMKRYGFFGANILTSDQLDVAERFACEGGLKGAERFVDSSWRTHLSGVPLLVDALAAIDCEIEDVIERHSHGIIIGRVLHLELSARTAAPAYWQGKYVALDQDEDIATLAEVSLPGGGRH